MYFTLSSPFVLGPALPLTGLTYPPVSLPLSIAEYSTGISTCCPSSTTIQSST